jgi:hypothetical protein
MLKTSLKERFEKKVQKTDGCHLWTAGTNHEGYGVIRDEDGRCTVAHRVAYELYVGPIPYHPDNGSRGATGIVVRHTCDNPSCVNPEHLRIGTQADNMKDRVDRGRWVGNGGFGTGPKLKIHQAYLIKRRFRDGASCIDIANEFGISRAMASRIKNGTAWSQVPDPPKI